jgi:hypothetical protein
MAVHIALHEIGVTFEGRPISLAKREQQWPQYLAAHYDRMMMRPAVKRTCEIESAIGYELPD